MFEKRPDPKDETIRILEEEVRHLREVNAELQKQVFALTSSSAYRLVHPTEDPPAVTGEIVRSPMERRGDVHRPSYTVGDIKEGWPES